MIFLFVIISQTIELKKVEHDTIISFETNRYGHFMIDYKGRSFHWALTGELLFKLDRKKKTCAFHPIPGGYAVTWLLPSEKRFGVEVISPFGEVQQELDSVLSWWYFDLRGQLYGSAAEWAQGETQVVPISTDGGKIAPSYARKHYFDPGSLGAPMDANFKHVWAVGLDDSVLFATPLEPILYQYTNGRYVGKIKVSIPWTPWQVMYRGSGYKSLSEYLKTFNRITYFGSSGHGLVLAVEQTDGRTTDVFSLTNEGIVKDKVTIPGWDKKGKVFTGSDGARSWVFDPAPFTATSVD